MKYVFDLAIVFASIYGVDRFKVRRHRDKGQFLTVNLPKKDKRRSLVDEKHLKEVKKRLKKPKATPEKVANAINEDPNLIFTTSRSTIIRRMVTPLKRKRDEGKSFHF